MKCRKCGKEFKIVTHGTECPSCYTLYKFTPDEMAELYDEAVKDEAKRRFAYAATKYKFLSYEGMTEAEYRFAECKEYGRGVKADADGACELYRAAAKKMLPEACIDLYRLMRDKKTAAIERGEAYYRLRMAAELGHAEAMNEYAECCRAGEIPVDESDEIIFWYTLASDKGNDEASLTLAGLYADGTGVECDHNAAAFYLARVSDDKRYKKRVKRLSRRIEGEEPCEPQKRVWENRGRSLYDLALDSELRGELSCAHAFLLSASELGYAKAQFRVAQCYENGLGTQKDEAAAAYWYSQAAKGRHIDAMLALGECYRDGRGVDKSYEKCIECYRRAADIGDARAICLLADIYFEGRICSRDMAKAVKLYQRSALKGYSPAMVKINEIFDGFTRVFNSAVEAQKSGDDVTAVRLYTIAAEMGHRASACNLGYCYQNGVGCKKNLKLAVHYYTIAAEDGSATAKFNLGMCYKNGGGVNVNFKMAEKLLSEAKDAGYQDDAEKLLDEIYRRRMKKRARAIYSAATEVYRRGEIEKAIKMRLTAAMMGSARAEYVLGCHFEYGDGLPQDTEKAKYYYKKAREHGFRDILLEMKNGFLREKRLLEYRN